MVYEKECVECGKIIDFGGRDHDRLPENGMEFEGKIYCKDCIEKFVKFGLGDNVMERISQMEEDLRKIKDQLGIEKHA